VPPSVAPSGGTSSAASAPAAQRLAPNFTKTAAAAAAAVAVAAAAAGRRAFIGPAWQNLGVTPAVLGALARAGRCYLKELSVHHYAIGRGAPAGVGDVLDEGRLRATMAKFTRLQVRL
jgi:hypothetical protein